MGRAQSGLKPARVCGVAKVSVYVARAARGRGVGRALLQALVQESQKNGIWTLQAGIFLENAASIAPCISHAIFAKSASGIASANSVTLGGM